MLLGESGVAAQPQGIASSGKGSENASEIGAHGHAVEQVPAVGRDGRKDLVLLRSNQDLLGAPARRTFVEVIEADMVGDIDQPLAVREPRGIELVGALGGDPGARPAGGIQDPDILVLAMRRIAQRHRHLPAVRRNANVLVSPDFAEHAELAPLPIHPDEPSPHAPRQVHHAVSGGRERQEVVFGPVADVARTRERVPRRASGCRDRISRRRQRCHARTEGSRDRQRRRWSPHGRAGGLPSNRERRA